MRKETLERWSRKVQTVNVMSKAQLARKEKTLIDALEEQLEDPTDRLAKRTRTPRSCAPVQAAKGVAEDGAIYDDADFYQQLLKELVEQRTVDGAEHEASAVPTVMLAASSRDARTRKNVDRKASKGRKMRFTVHEKLQNFMAPEDRRGWEQPAIDRFFGTLFGQRLGLAVDRRRGRGGERGRGDGGPQGEGRGRQAVWLKGTRAYTKYLYIYYRRCTHSYYPYKSF